MRKYILLLITILLPLSVKALAVSETFDVGDSVSVALYDGYKNENENGIGFHVLRASAAGEKTVTLIYDGVIAGSSSVYDETIPATNGEGHEATAVLEEAVIGTKLNQYVNKEGAKWNVETVSLLSESDLAYLGIAKNVVGNYEIPAKYSFLAPIKQEGWPQSNYNYWTMIKDNAATSTSVFYVKYNENLDKTDTNAIWATIESQDITSITKNATYAIRPVVVIDKEYILCNNSKTPTEPTSEKTPESPKTGVEDYLIPLGVVLILASVAVVVTKKKDAFSRI